MDELESSRQKEVNVENLDQFVSDDVDGKGEGLDSQVHDSLRVVTKADALQMKFDSVGDAEVFFNAYAKVTGFSIRRSRIKTNTENKLK